MMSFPGELPGYPISPAEITAPLEHEPGWHHLQTKLLRFIGAAAVAVCLVTMLNGDVRAGPPLTKQQVATYFMDTRTAYINGCSASLIQDPQTGENVGVETASHCEWRQNGKLGFTGDWINGSDGRTYDVRPEGATVRIGQNTSRMQTVGEINEVILPRAGSHDSDLAIGAFKNHTAAEVLADYQASRLTLEQIAQLMPGKEQLYMAGYPAQQTNNGHNNLDRQEITMTYAGIQPDYKNAFDDVNEPVVWAAAVRNSDGASCTPGASGSEGFVVINGVVKSVGTLTAYTSLSDPAIRAGFEAAFPDVDWTHADYACGFSPVLPSKVVEVVKSAESIPVQPNVTVNNAAEIFYSPNYDAAIVNGTVSFYVRDFKDGKTINTEMFVDRPILFTNPDGTLVLGYFDKAHDILRVISVDRQALRFYQDNPNNPLSLTRVRRTEDPPAHAASFYDKNGAAFGTLDAAAPTNTGKITYELFFNHSKWEFVGLKS